MPGEGGLHIDSDFSDANYSEATTTLATSLISSSSTHHNLSAGMEVEVEVEVDVVDGIEIRSWETQDDLDRYTMLQELKSSHRGGYNYAVKHRQGKAKKVTRTKRTSLPSKQKVKHEIYTDACNPIVSTSKLKCIYNEFIHESLKQEAKNKRTYLMPPPMDENYVHNSLRALDSTFLKNKPNSTPTNSCSTATISTIGTTNGKIEGNNRTNFKKESIQHDIVEKNHVLVKDGSRDAKLLEKEIETDITEIISRHSKREIRLPARYHQSDFLMGTPWDIPELEFTEKVPRKRLKTGDLIESSASHLSPSLLSILTSSPSSSPTSSASPSFLSSSSHSHHTVKPLNSCENQRLSLGQNSTPQSLMDRKRDINSNSQSESKVKRHSNESNRQGETGKNYFNRVNSCKDNSPHSYQIKLHREKLEKIQMLRQKAELHDPNLKNSDLIHTVNHKDVLNESSVKMSPHLQSPRPHASDACHTLSIPATTSSAKPLVAAPIKNDDNNNTFRGEEPSVSAEYSTKSSKLLELREAYRALYLENRPERKIAYARSRIKPRVNKKFAVEEAIKTIEKLKTRERQLEYIKKVLTMWNRKLTIAAKVISDKDVMPKAVEVVQGVLRAYQSSKTYKITESLGLKSPEHVESTIMMPSVSLEALPVRSGQDESKDLTKPKAVRRKRKLTLTEQYSSGPKVHSPEMPTNRPKSPSPVSHPDMLSNKKTYANIGSGKRVGDVDTCAIQVPSSSISPVPISNLSIQVTSQYLDSKNVTTDVEKIKSAQLIVAPSATQSTVSLASSKPALTLNLNNGPMLGVVGDFQRLFDVVRPNKSPNKVHSNSEAETKDDSLQKCPTLILSDLQSSNHINGSNPLVVKKEFIEDEKKVQVNSGTAVVSDPSLNIFNNLKPLLPTASPRNPGESPQSAISKSSSIIENVPTVTSTTLARSAIIKPTTLILSPSSSNTPSRLQNPNKKTLMLSLISDKLSAERKCAFSRVHSYLNSNSMDSVASITPNSSTMILPTKTSFISLSPLPATAAEENPC